MRLLWLHSYYQSLELCRQPMYLITTVLFPSMFFWFFGVPNAQSEPAALILLGSFSAYAVLGVVLFQFGVGIAQERGTPWSAYLRILPAPAWVGFFSRIVSGLFFAAIAVGGVIWTASAFTPVPLDSGTLSPFLWILLAGSLPFGLMGIVIGLTCKAQSALPVANLVYLPLSFAGGLWLPPNALPAAVQDISPYLPSRMYGDLVWNSLQGLEQKSQSIWGLVAYTIFFFALALYLVHREEERSYS
jgi:ABC-2 type transport system permease protein